MAPVDISSDATKLKAKSRKENICILLDFEFSRYFRMAPKLKEREFQKNILFLQDPDDD